jgi:hypothetical protein
LDGPRDFQSPPPASLAGGIQWGKGAALRYGTGDTVLSKKYIEVSVVDVNSDLHLQGMANNPW